MERNAVLARDCRVLADTVKQVMPEIRGQVPRSHHAVEVLAGGGPPALRLAGFPDR
jgi:hypothetical protein